MILGSESSDLSYLHQWEPGVTSLGYEEFVVAASCLELMCSRIWGSRSGKMEFSCGVRNKDGS